ncbi:MAG: zinc dependent phospholipase C family protein [Deltaproteobacteria bacterium]|nr:zinc dependent phospholipase C family protein [Deltaproteobacteria bacterium]
MTLFLKFVVFFAVYLIIQLLRPENALAWGPGVHTAIALGSLDAASQFLPSIGRIITAFPIEYLYGSLSADFFIGKAKKKRSGAPHNWEGGFKFLGDAGDDREMSYAFGFLSHLAADVIAHNYFIPNLTSAYPGKRKMGHLFWEIRSDYLIGTGYTSIANGVLNMDHQVCDDLLQLLGGKKRNRLKTKKRVFTQTVKLSDYLYTTRNLFFETRAPRGRVFHEYLAAMVDLSRRLVYDFLKHPDSSPCLHFDPIGAGNLLMAKGKRSFPRIFRNAAISPHFDVDEKLLYL